jgi:hypothetical protein
MQRRMHGPIHGPLRSNKTGFSMIGHGRKSRQVVEKIGGASRDRTDDLIVAKDGVCQFASVFMPLLEPITFQNVPIGAFSGFKNSGLPEELPHSFPAYIPSLRTHHR